MNVQFTSMNAPSLAELTLVKEAGAGLVSWAGDFAVHWQSAFGVITIEVRDGQVYVNGDLVQPAVSAPVGALASDAPGTV
jgi:hypothetical protein